jgi:choline dehydrogenase
LYLEIEVDAFGEIPGITYPPDSGAGAPGVFWYPTSADPQTMTRSLSRTAHWDGIVRDNYHTITGTKVLKVVFEGDRASGVSYIPAMSKNILDSSTVKARKEVIIAAGTIHTPQILQASGIGDRNLLTAAGIEIKVHLPGVGSNFQDHPINGGASFVCQYVWRLLNTVILTLDMKLEISQLIPTQRT